MRKLTKLRIDEISSVDRGAGENCRIILMKRDAPQGVMFFNDIMLAKADTSDVLRGPRDEPDDKKLSAKLDEIVAEIIVASPSLHPNRARRWLLHTPHGRELLLQHATKKRENIMPQVNMMKLATVMEDALNAQVTKRDGESFAQAFSRRYENDIDFRKSWAAVTEAKHLSVMKGMATLEPTSTSVGNTNVSDDSAEAVRLLQEMAAKNGRSFETEFADPANAKLASRTYTANHRSSVSADYLEQ
jgi:hypothetical protein